MSEPTAYLDTPEVRSGIPPALRGWFESLDEMRRRTGRMLDRINLGRQETEFEVVFSRPAVRLRVYGKSREGSPVLLIVPAPIKRPYIWDLSPERSVVRKAIERGFDIYLVEWTEAQDDEARFGLEEYALVALEECIEAIRSRSQSSRIFVAGHSLGGTFAGLYSACHPEHVKGLVLIEAPLHFAEASGAFKRMLDAGGPAQALLQSSRPVPGSLINLMSLWASPKTFQHERYLDFVASLGSRTNLETHVRVERWTLDELPMARRLFDEVVEQLYRNDRFMHGELTLGNRRIHPRDVTSPVFAVFDPNSHIIPPASLLAFYEQVGSRDKQSMPYPGDTGVALQHVGALVGENAHRLIWPRIFDWMERRSSE
ncbi:alpha/beta fold hydrolase [Aromatoleum aromaticum]|uniref:PHA synthase subunit PhaC n=1 Tax=Aromatoleum aromaticum (strain DSM 19018 / LMG 30748 / EbN1) TaxID=76114 RepID=Q5NZ38_AROAE|nr:alpha/beta fold hydrolase [Aromatoleum aromaticum]NMG55620.1 alpha/beta fold hydrolase [Aromatoleum aromaticum]CAI09676.1 PHA synthase subunit PhaC [Aromatoleum aromaticum EbN1]